MHWTARWPGMWHSHCAARGIENGSESQTRHDWQRRPGITSATTDLEIVDLSRTMSAPPVHWARTSGPPKAQQLRNLAFVTFGKHDWTGASFLLVSRSSLTVHTVTVRTYMCKRQPSAALINHPPWTVHFLVSHTRKKSERMQVRCGVSLGRQRGKKEKLLEKSLWAALG
jgi:hypothetical protein